MSVHRHPLFRILAVKLGIGAVVAVLACGGLLVLNAGGLRDLLLANRALALVFGLVLIGSLAALVAVVVIAAALMTSGDGSR